MDLDGADELIALSKKVRSGDPGNLEAIAAKKYWAHLFSKIEFSRLPGTRADNFNSSFDYAYTVLRSHGIRAVVSAGLSGALGIFHRGRSNPFALVDDLIEPFRPAVDYYVLSTAHPFDLKDPEVKRRLVSAADSTFGDDGRSIATELVALGQSFGRYAEGDISKLPVPRWRGLADARERQ